MKENILSKFANRILVWQTLSSATIVRTYLKFIDNSKNHIRKFVTLLRGHR
jgi:hypothetical protein